MWGGPPDINSHLFWDGPGAGTFFASAAELEALAGLLLSILGGHQAVAAGLSTAWDAPTGMTAIAANLPNDAWLTATAAQLSGAAARIAATGEAFETFKAATPTPAEVNENQVEHGVLQANNIFGLLFPAIAANRARYGEMWTRASTNGFGYTAASTAGVGSIEPVAPPTPTATPMSGGAESAAQLAAQQPMKEAMDGQAMSAVMPMAQQLIGAPAQLGQMMSGGGPLGSVTQLPQQAMGPFTSMLGQLGGGGGLDGLGGAQAATGPWINGTPAAGGPVSASLSGAGGGGGFGGGGGAISALRAPASWSSTVNAAGPGAAESSAVSRIAEARAASTMPATSGAMGSSGAMMPMAQAAHRGQDNESGERDTSGTLLAAAALYREPAGVPVVTGGSGAQYLAGEGDR
jgi:PPE-repeat protein